MEGVVVKVFQANIEVASKLIPLPITAQEAKDALRGINATWVGRLKESNRSLVLAGQCQLDPAAIYHLHLQEQKGPAMAPVDTSFEFFNAAMVDRSHVPSTFEALPPSLGLLSQPLPIVPHIYNQLSLSGDRHLRHSLQYQIQLRERCQPDSASCWAVYQLVTAPMMSVLTALGVDHHVAGDNAGSPGATSARQRPDGLLSFRNVLMFKAELKAQRADFGIAYAELLEKWATWSPRLHGDRDYLLCLAAAGPLLQFFAVRNEGGGSKAVSKQYNMAHPLDCLQIIHCALRVLTIMLQQREHQLPAAPTPLGMTCRVGNTSITYDHDCITKVVRWQGFANDDEQLLQHVYDVLWHLPNGAGLQHPRGLLKPIAPPRLSDGRWRAEFPLCTACNPVTLPRLRMMVADVLHGLQALHQHNIVHRDVRPPNILEAGDEAYVLIDYEHAGVANQTARFAPLDHWPVECKAPGAVYTPAADVYSVGWVMRRSGLALDAEALAFCNQLIGPATARPSAADALQLPRLAGL